MDNVDFVSHVTSRLDELRKERNADIHTEEAAGISKPAGLSAFANAKGSFKKVLSLNIATPNNATLYEIFTDKQLFTKYGDSYYAVLLEIENKKADSNNRKVNTDTARNTKSALKLIFDVIGKKLKTKAALTARAATIAKENSEVIDLDGLNFCETLNTLCERHFPDVTVFIEKAKLLFKVSSYSSVSKYNNWISGLSSPMSLCYKTLKTNIKALTELEVFFDVPDGTLVKFTPSGVGLIDPADMVSLMEQPEQINAPYPFSDKVKDQFERFEVHMKGKGNPIKLKKYLPFAKFRDLSDLRPPAKIWTDSGDSDESLTAKGIMGQINTYRHWLIRSGIISDPDKFRDSSGFYQYFHSKVDEITSDKEVSKRFRSAAIQRGDSSYKRLMGEDLKVKILDDPIAERKLFIKFVNNEGMGAFTGLEGFVDFDMSYLLTSEYVIDFCLSRKKDGVTKQVRHFLSTLGTSLGVIAEEVGYLSLMHPPIEQLCLDEAKKDSFDYWVKEEKSLLKYVVQEKNALLLAFENNKEDDDVAVGKRNIQHLISSDVRENLGLSGGVKSGYVEYMKIVAQLEKDAQVFGNALDSISFHCIQSALFMRLMLEQPMRLDNWATLRIVSQQESLRASFPCIWKHKSAYHLRVPPRFVKNHRKLETTFTPLASKAIGNYLVARDALLVERGLTSDKFLLGSKGGKFKGFPLLKYTYKAQKVLWPEREFITWGFNPHSLRHFAATVYMAYHPEGIFRCADLIQDKPQTVIDNYIEPDTKGAAKAHTDHNIALQKVFEASMAAEAAM